MWLKKRKVKTKTKKGVVERTTYAFEITIGQDRYRKLLDDDYEEAIRRGKAFYQEILEQRAQAEEVARPKPLTVAKFKPTWLSNRVPQTRQYKDAEELARQRFEDHIEPHLGDLALQDVTRQRVDEMISQFHNKRNGKPLAKATEKHILLDLVSFIQYAVTCGHIDRNRLPEFEKIAPKVKKKAPKPISEEDQALIFSDLAAYTDELFHVKLARWTGWRQRNLFEIRWGDVYLDVDPAYAVLRETKNGESYKVPLTDQAIELLRGRRKQLGRIIHQDEPVSPVRLEQVDSIYQKSSRRISKRLRRRFVWNIHRMRDTLGCWLVDNGVPLQDVQALLGHKSITMTEKYASREFRRTAASLRGIGTPRQIDRQIVASIKP